MKISQKYRNFFDKFEENPHKNIEISQSNILNKETYYKFIRDLWDEQKKKKKLLYDLYILILKTKII